MTYNLPEEAEYGREIIIIKSQQENFITIQWPIDWLSWDQILLNTADAHNIKFIYMGSEIWRKIIDHTTRFL
jgi:hypothetical protein